MVWSYTIGEWGITQPEREKCQKIEIFNWKTEMRSLESKRPCEENSPTFCRMIIKFILFSTSSIMSVILDDSLHGNSVFNLEKVAVALLAVLVNWEIRGTDIIYVKSCGNQLHLWWQHFRNGSISVNGPEDKSFVGQKLATCNRNSLDTLKVSIKFSSFHIRHRGEKINMMNCGWLVIQFIEAYCEFHPLWRSACSFMCILITYFS